MGINKAIKCSYLKAVARAISAKIYPKFTNV